MAPKSSMTNCFFANASGTSPFTILWASPSTIAVLPTPGSPIKTGLFFFRRERTCMLRLISSSRPITGSSFPSRASPVISRPNLSRASYPSSAFGERAPRPLRNLLIASFKALGLTPALVRILLEAVSGDMDKDNKRYSAVT